MGDWFWGRKAWRVVEGGYLPHLLPSNPTCNTIVPVEDEDEDEAPADSCSVKLDEVCPKPRQSDESCASCANAQRSKLAQAGCTVKRVQELCAVTDACHIELTTLCWPWASEAACKSCSTEQWSDLQAVGCTTSRVDELCGAVPA